MVTITGLAYVKPLARSHEAFLEKCHPIFWPNVVGFSVYVQVALFPVQGA